MCNMKLLLFMVDVMLQLSVQVHGLYMYEDSIDHYGTEFVLMILNNVRHDLPYEIYLTTPVPGPVTVRVHTPIWDSDDTVDITVNVFNYNMSIVTLPESLRNNDTGKTNKSILVTSDNVIAVFISNTQRQSAGYSIIYPTVRAGTEYVTVSYHTDKNENTSLAGVIALENTTITINPPDMVCVMYEGICHQEEMNVNLIKYEVLQIMAWDITGTFLSSESPFVAFSGHTFSSLFASSSDHFEVMLLPIQSLSLQYLVVPKPSFTKPELIRIVSAAPNATVSISNSSDTLMIQLDTKGTYYDFYLSSSEGAVVTSDKAIIVAQISISNCVVNSDGDPSMSLALAPHQMLSEYAFCATLTADVNMKMVNLIIISSQNDISSIKLNNEYLNSSIAWESIGGSDFIYTEILNLQPGRHYLISENPLAKLGGVLYGYGRHVQFQTTIGRYLGETTEQIDIAKDVTTEPFRQSNFKSRYTDYLPGGEAPFYNTTTMFKGECATLCIQYSSCFVMAIGPPLFSDGFDCILYTVVAASKQFEIATGYTLYVRLDV